MLTGLWVREGIRGDLQKENNVNDDSNRILVQRYSLLQPVGFWSEGAGHGGRHGNARVSYSSVENQDKEVVSVSSSVRGRNEATCKEKVHPRAGQSRRLPPGPHAIS